MPRLTVLSLLATPILIAALMADAAHATLPLKTRDFRVSVKGVQTTAWSYDVPSSSECDPPDKGDGTEVVRFATKKPALIRATRLSPTYLQFGSGKSAGALAVPAKVTRQGKIVTPPKYQCGGKGGGQTLAPDCGTKRATLRLRISHEAFFAPRGVKLRNQGTSVHDLFDNCPVDGIAFPTLLDKTQDGKDIASDWPIDEIIEGRAGKTIVIGRGRRVTDEGTRRHETTIRWEATFRPVGKARTVRAAQPRAFAARSARYKGTTAGGGRISFKLAGQTVSNVNGGVPTVCLESMGSYESRSGVELFQPPGTFRLGASAQRQALQPAAMNQGIKATKTYTLSSRRAGNRRVRGTLKLSFSFLRPGPSIYQSYIYRCSSSVSFSAKEQS